MRITIKRGNKNVIPKLKLGAAAEKLAKYEDVEEKEELEPLIRNLRKAAKARKKEDPAVASLLRQSADIITVMNDFEKSQSLMLRRQMSEQKIQLLAFLDDIDGQINDDNVSLIREKLEEVMK